MSEVNRAGDRWAVLIGINGYHESLGRLKYSVNDCRRLAQVLTTGEDAFPANHVLVLTDDEAAERKPTYANIHSWLASWLAQLDDDDTVLVFFAGHGREMEGKCYLVPGDATLQTIHVTGIPVPHVQELLNRCKARQKVLILDACHSGAGRDVAAMAAPMMETLSAGKGIYTLTSCDVNELSHECDEKQQGVFSYYLAEALGGSCPPDGHGHITADRVYEWVFDRVREWTRLHRCTQAPKRICDVAGSVILRCSEPDWRRLAAELQAQLTDTRRELDHLRDRKWNEEPAQMPRPSPSPPQSPPGISQIKYLADSLPHSSDRYEMEETLDAIARLVASRASVGDRCGFILIKPVLTSGYYAEATGIVVNGLTKRGCVVLDEGQGADVCVMITATHSEGFWKGHLSSIDVLVGTGLWREETFLATYPRFKNVLFEGTVRLPRPP
jgi:hypothetical protein